jgi:Na+/H+ antiporter NhaD/arsenite permease-like protein
MQFMSDIAIIFTLVVVVVGLFAWNRIPVVIVAIGMALALYATGILDLGQALAGLGDPAVIFIAALFVISAGLDVTGVTAWAGKMLIAKAGKSHKRLLLLIMLLVALLTALISFNGAVAALLPMVVVMAIKLGRSPSKLLMPLVFAAHAGSMLTLTGTPVNVLASEASRIGSGLSHGFAGRALHYASLQVYQLDYCPPGGRDDAAFNSHGQDRCGEPDGREAR